MSVRELALEAHVLHTQSGRCRSCASGALLGCGLDAARGGMHVERGDCRTGWGPTGCSRRRRKEGRVSLVHGGDVGEEHVSPTPAHLGLHTVGGSNTFPTGTPPPVPTPWRPTSQRGGGSL